MANENVNVKVIFYVPNLIGYIRLILLIACFFIGLEQLYLILIITVIANTLDLLDGYTARTLDQRSNFGAMLDFLIDRLETIIYVMFIGLAFPDLYVLLNTLLALDILSHMSRLYTTLLQNQHHHKSVYSMFSLLNLYYKPWILALTCAFYNLIFLFLGIDYVLGYCPYWLQILFAIAFPGFIFKTVILILQLAESFKLAIAKDSY